MAAPPISRGRVSHSDSGLNTVGGVLSCPWFVNDWHSLRIMPPPLPRPAPTALLRLANHNKANKKSGNH